MEQGNEAATCAWLASSRAQPLLALEAAWLARVVLPKLYLNSSVLLIEGSRQLLPSSIEPIHMAIRTTRQGESFHIQSDPAAFSFADNVFDLVVVSHAHEMLTDTNHFLAESYRVVKGEGLIVVMGRNPLSPSLWYCPGRTQCLYRHQVIAQIRQLGAQVIDHTSLNHSCLSFMSSLPKTYRCIDALMGAWFPSMGSLYAVLAKKQRSLPISPDTSETIDPTWAKCDFCNHYFSSSLSSRCVG